LPLPPLGTTAAAGTESGVIKRPPPGTKPKNGDDAPTLDDFGPAVRSGSGYDDGMSPAPAGGGGPVITPRPGRSGTGGMAAAARAPAMPGGAAAGGYDGMGGGMANMGTTLANAPPPKYKLIRVTDLTAEVGHKYRYKMQVILHDPNHPATERGYVAPNPASLAAEVRTRVKALDSSVFYVESDWSEPSPVVELPRTCRFFAGTAKQPELRPLIAGKPEVPNTTHPEAKALAVVWDSTKVVDVPAEVNVHRGSILNFVEDAQVIHPVTHEIVDLSKYAFSTNAIVADIMGGEEIPLLDKRTEKQPLVAPGELLIFDAEGNLHVQNETDDIEGFRRYLVPEPSEESVRSPMGDPMGGFGGILDVAPMPGMAPPVRPKR
jgi:hypothetical protein